MIHPSEQDVCKSIPEFLPAVKGSDQYICPIYPRQAYRRSGLMDDNRIWIRSEDLWDQTVGLSWKPMICPSTKHAIAIEMS